MDNNNASASASASGKRGGKQPRQAPPKVVHISNPMKLETSASDFRSIVQELTGQHAVWPVDPSKFSASRNQTPTNNNDEDSSAADLSDSTRNNTATDTGKDYVYGTADVPSSDGSAGSSDDLCLQPLDQDATADDRVVLIDHHMLHYMLHDHQDFAGFAQSRDVDSTKKF